MEVSMMQGRQAITSGATVVYHSNSLAWCNFCSAKSVLVWKPVQRFREQRVVCQSASGGSRRDQQKIVARTQKRRSRHVKGVTPTKPELLDELQQEEDADEELERTFPYSDEEDEPDFEGNEEDGPLAVNASAQEAQVEATMVLLEKPSPLPGLTGEAELASDISTNGKPKTGIAESDNAGDHDVRVEKERWDQASGDGDESRTSISGEEERVESGDNTYTVRFFPEDAEGQENVQKRAEGVPSNVQKGVEQAQSVMGQVSEIAGDTAREVSDTAQDTAEETGKNLREAGDVIRENVEEALGEVGPVTEELTGIAQDTVQDVAATAQKTVGESAQSLKEAGNIVGEGLSEVAAQEEDLAREGANALGEQFRQGRKEAEKSFSNLRSEVQTAGDRTGKSLEKITAEFGKSAENVLDAVATPVLEIPRTVGVVGGEALRLGEVVLNAGREAAGVSQEIGPGPKSFQSNGNGTKQSVEESSEGIEKQGKKQREQEKPEGQTIQSKNEQPARADQPRHEDENPYIGFKVTVAGASGRTGRLIVEELASKGLQVRALVRDPAKARYLEKWKNVEVVKADLYKYEVVKKALGDSNVVICAIGASSFPFDPIGTYQAEFEGVKNLVAAARNGGSVKKFVLITSIGVTFLQIVPLIFWKKQAELYLQRSGLDYTIIRPGGLTNGSDKREKVAMQPADSQFSGSISRKKVAELCVGALVTPEASEKIVEVVSGGRDGQSLSELFGSV